MNIHLNHTSVLRVISFSSLIDSEVPIPLYVVVCNPTFLSLHSVREVQLIVNIRKQNDASIL